MTTPSVTEHAIEPHGLETVTFDQNHKRQTRALNAALKQGDLAHIIDVAQEALTSFDLYGWPDDWTKYQRAADDAAFRMTHV